MSGEKIPRAQLVRIGVFFLGAIALLVLLNVFYQANSTLSQLEVVERERDQWQRPAEIIQALDIKDGSVVADLGCGAGYFALKLASATGPRGEVLAVDLRLLPLLFLRVRAYQKNRQNLRIIHAEPDNPGLPSGRLDAVLVANTYHELAHPQSMLDTLFRSLKPGGRLVVVDRGPEPAHEGHGLPLPVAEQAIRQSAFEIVSRDDHFLDQPGDESWWMIVARRPLR
jgi:ubiquinone/menaquinone biosynthesis C-methylase UbiE